MEFCILGSSSAGNCTAVRTPRTCFLIDAGFSGRKIVNMLQMKSLQMASVSAIFLTHEHTDHISGLRGLASYEHLQVLSNKNTATIVQRTLTKKLNWRFFNTGDTFIFEDVAVTTFGVPHDAHDPVSYLFRQLDCAGNPSGPSLAWVADLGHIPPNMADPISQVDCLIIESNYDEALLEADTKRSFALKQRIRGRHGHLSNTDTRAFLCSAQSPRWQQVHCVHLSRDCNHVDRVAEHRHHLRAADRHFPLHIVDPHGEGASDWCRVVLN